MAWLSVIACSKTSSGTSRAAIVGLEQLHTQANELWNDFQGYKKSVGEISGVELSQHIHNGNIICQLISLLLYPLGSISYFYYSSEHVEQAVVHNAIKA
jgi:hypothetical protein